MVSQEGEFTTNSVTAARIKADRSYCNLCAEISGLQGNAGHGLHFENVKAIAAIPELSCLNTGHAIIVRAVLGGLYEAATTMKK